MQYVCAIFKMTLHGKKKKKKKKKNWDEKEV